MSKKNVSYDDFVEKFKPKKTTDDCYTPPLVYDAVLDWARKHLDIGDRPVVRPFYPGGDFEHYDYPEDCVVVDNPPFSIFAKICDWYVEHNIPFLLFAPAMSSIRKNCTYIGASCSITYENGANVNTAFVTNMMGDLICTTAPEIYRAVKTANDAQLKEKKKTLAKLSLPDCVLRASTLHTMSRAGIMFEVRRGGGCVVHRACTGRGEFGSSILLSERMAAKKLAAEKLAAEKLAAKKLAAKKLAAEKLAAEKLVLSDKSKELIRQLNSAPTSDQPPSLLATKPHRY